VPDWAVNLNDFLFRFVTRGPAWQHVLVFLPLGLLLGVGAARWSSRLIARESDQTRRLSRAARLAVIGAVAAGCTALVLATIHGKCQELTEGGSIDWWHWRMLYQDALIVLLIVATAIDFDQYLIPDEITLSGVIVGVLGGTLIGHIHMVPVWIDWNLADPIRGAFIPEWIRADPHWPRRSIVGLAIHGHGLAYSLAGLVAGGGITWLARWIARIVLGVEALGFGDVTLMAMIGSFLGWQPVLFVFLLAPLCGIVIGLIWKLLHGRRAIPYGPYLSAATLIVLFTWRWLWIPTRDVFGHWPTLVALALMIVAGLAALLGVLRLYRSIPVTRRAEAIGDHDAEGRPGEN
jgi:leader peptidase (prepilin peptidase) / N-methyltransferase